MSKRPLVGGVGINGWLLLAQVIDAPGPRWSPEWSDALDAVILRMRRESQRPWADPNRTADKHWHEAPPLTPDEERRRDRAARAMARSADPDHAVRISQARKAARAQRPGTVRWPQPRPINGRWLMTFVHQGQQYRAWFDTEQEARNWAQQVKSA